MSKKKERDFGIGAYTPQSIINNHLLFSSFENEFSFPNWFNDSIIKATHLTTITRNIYEEGLILNENDSVRPHPAKRITYFFNKKGEVHKLHKIEYFDFHKITETTITYKKTDGKIGFSAARVDSIFSFSSDKKSNLKKNNQTIYRLKKNDDFYQTYKKTSDPSQLFVLNNPSDWGPLKIKRTFHPKTIDRIVLGSMSFPEKAYSVRNTVEEFNLEHFNYEKGLIHSIEKIDFPFISKRSFQYDKRGYCIRYIDSLFSDKEYLTRTISKFTNNMLFSPTQIIHTNESNEQKKSFHHIETFAYEYRK